MTSPKTRLRGEQKSRSHPPDLSETASVTQGANARCADLLGHAVAALAAADGAVYLCRPNGALEAHSAYRDVQPWMGGTLKEAAHTAMRGGRPVLSVVTRGPSDRLSGMAERYMALPLSLDQDPLGVLVLIGLAGDEPSPEVELRRLGQLPEMIAHALERARLLAALAQRGEEVGALRQQLDVYALDFRSTYQAEQDRAQQLADALAELERTYKTTVGALALAVEAKDECTGGHLQRVCKYGMLLTSLVAPEHANDPQFEYGFLLHDVGKLTVPDAVLNKAGALTDAEWEVMRQHPGRGRSILEGVDFLAGAREIVYSHHERWDGNGYPRGLRGTEIPLGALIFPLCDAFDAMTTNRPYRTAMPVAAALDQVRVGSGSQFWADAVEAFLSISPDVLGPIARERGAQLL
ncbi:MAG TPA: HD domain-containing phosphohydrolase [Acidimicrobiales bacterium]|nr:HD domain-containing phosphohydrolase [Acidimicrobiales bacterium]